MNKLYVMIGAPGSGKSTFAKNYITDATYVSRDEVRSSIIEASDSFFSKEQEVYRQFIWRIYDQLQNKHHDVIADATHITENSRSKLFKALPLDYSKIEVIGVYMHTPFNTCLKRNALRSGREKVPQSELSKMFYKMQPPNFREYRSIFDTIWDVYTDKDKPQIKVFKKEAR